MLVVSGVLAAIGYLLSPDSETGQFWVGSLWMLLSPLILVSRHTNREFANLQTFVLRSPRRSQIHLIECGTCLFSVLLVAAVVCKELSWAGLAMGGWGALLCGTASVLEQTGRRRVSVLSIVSFGGFLLWSCPFWLGPWLGEPGYTPWLASWVMWLHPVSQALTFSGLSNLIEPVFYSLTFIGVVEVELFDPHWGLLLVMFTTVGMFGYSYLLNRRRSAVPPASLTENYGV